jgi:hypothetical protein
MAIFTCVGYFYFHIPEEICFAGVFLPFLARGYILHVSICVFCCFSSLILLFLVCVVRGKKYLHCYVNSLKELERILKAAVVA